MHSSPNIIRVIKYNIINETAWMEYAACMMHTKHGYRLLVKHLNGRQGSGKRGLYEMIVF
jgi:hypothetical protein